MNRPPKITDKVGMYAASERAAERVKRDIDYATDLAADAKHSARVEAQECKACYYPLVHYGRMAGRATCTAPCSICGTEMQFSDTSIDACCIGCARKHSLCKHCGGDLNMRPRRRKWPTPWQP